MTSITPPSTPTGSTRLDRLHATILLDEDECGSIGGKLSRKEVSSTVEERSATVEERTEKDVQSGGCKTTEDHSTNDLQSDASMETQCGDAFITPRKRRTPCAPEVRKPRKSRVARKLFLKSGKALSV